MIFKSIRWRLQLWHGLILVIVLTGFGLAAYQAARENQSRRVEGELEQRINMAFRPGPGPQDQRPDEPPRGPRRDGPGDWRNNPPFRNRIRPNLDQTGAFAETNSFYYVLWREDGSRRNQVSRRACPRAVALRACRRRFPDKPVWIRPRTEPPAPGPPANSIFRTRGEFREVYRLLPAGDCLLVGRSIAPELAAMRRFALWLASAGAAILALGLAGGWWVAGRVLRPVEAISTTAAKISAGDLSQRINLADTESELGRLAGVLNSTFSRLESSFAHQARFTSDASHELRTPISVILTQIQSALSREREPGDYREALQACERAAQRMRRLTDSLLELAKLDAGQNQISRDPFDLARVARESVDLVRPLATRAALPSTANSLRSSAWETPIESARCSPTF